MAATWIAPVVTVFASFTGALVAFWLENSRQKRKRTSQEVAAINRTLMTLLLHARVISHYRDGAIGEYDKTSTDRAFKVERSHPFDLDRYSYDFASLDFMSSIDEQATILKLYEEEDYFRATLRAINIRDKLAYDEVDPAALRAGVADGQEHDVDEFRKILGTPLFNAYQSKTDEVVDCVEHELPLINETIREFRTAAAAHHPKSVIIDIDIPREENAP